MDVKPPDSDLTVFFKVVFTISVFLAKCILYWHAYLALNKYLAS
jgi:hypothetical protein